MIICLLCLKHVARLICIRQQWSEGNHLKYNSFVKYNLDVINNYQTQEEQCCYLWLFVCYLKKI